jgi:hypothetical protein
MGKTKRNKDESQRRKQRRAEKEAWPDNFEAPIDLNQDSDKRIRESSNW